MADLGTPRRQLAKTTSTMADARVWAQSGAPHGAMVVADHQTEGRGRHGRVWTAAPDESLLFTLVLRPAIDPASLGWISLAAGLAVAEAVDAVGVSAHIKWPNDVRVDGRKLAGVLAESVHQSDGLVVLLGVGLNVRQSTFPDGLAATSIQIETSRDLDPSALLSPILDALAARISQVVDTPEDLRRAVCDRLEAVGDSVSVRDPTTSALLVSGTVLGIDGDGALRLSTNAGERHVHAGEVTLSP